MQIFPKEKFFDKNFIQNFGFFFVFSQEKNYFRVSRGLLWVFWHRMINESFRFGKSDQRALRHYMKIEKFTKVVP